jgi:hypothetical protein
MLLPAGKKNPKALMVMGMSCLVVAILWSNAPIFSRHLTPNWNHGLQGFFYGLSIGLNLYSVVLASRQRRNRNACGTA